MVQTQEYELNSPQLVSVMDDCWVWSYPFGEKILQMVDYRTNLHALDVGCGTGFPTIELSQRLGETCRTWGIDVWQAAIQRACQKVQTWNLHNIEFLNCNAYCLPFPDDYFDLIVSNNGINNIADDALALHEMARVARPNAQLLITVNLPDTFQEFYKPLQIILQDMGKSHLLATVQEHIYSLRKPAHYTKKLVADAGFSIQQICYEQFTWRYANAEAMMNHFFIKLAFLDGWRNCLDDDCDEIIKRVQHAMDLQAENGITMTVPWICIHAKMKE